MVFPNQADRGTHINLSGAIVAVNAPNRANALRLVEYLSSQEAQALYAELNHEIPVKPGTRPASIVEGWGPFKTDAIEVHRIGELRARASRLVDEVRYDQGS